MCTVLYLNDLNLLSKNRDKDTAEDEEVVSTDDVLAIRTRGADYYSLGINKHGCAFVSTAVNSPEWTAAIENGDFDQAKTIMEDETRGKEGPSHLLSRHLHEVRTVDDCLQILDGTNFNWRGYNIVLMDHSKAVHIEAYGQELDVVPLNSRYIVTNHFRRLSWGPRKRSDYVNSFDRFAYAEEKINSITNHEGLLETIAPSANNGRQRIWREDSFQTISSTVLDLKGACLYRCVDAGQPFEVHKITTH